MYHLGFCLFLVFFLCSCHVDSNSESSELINAETVVIEEKSTWEDPNSDDSVHVVLTVQKTEKQRASLDIDMNFFGESWVVSPNETDYPYGCMLIEIEPNELIKKQTHEVTTSDEVERSDLNWEKPYSVLENSAHLSHELKIESSQDFKVNGRLFFVLEPVCNPIQIKFQLIQESGKLRIESKKQELKY